MASPSSVFRQSPEEILRLVRSAILERHALKVIYEERERLLCPQMLGRSKAGQRRVLCLQIGGESTSGLRKASPGNWRCLALEKLQYVEEAVAGWTGGDPVRRPKCIDQVELEVSSASTGT